MEVIKIANTNFDFERFLNNEKDSFCKFRCRYSDKISTKIHCGGCAVDCDECNALVDLYGEDIEIEPCEYCMIDEFIREIRDCKIKVLE